MYCCGPTGRFLLFLLAFLTLFLTFGLICLDWIVDLNRDYDLWGQNNLAFVIVLTTCGFVVVVGLCLLACALLVTYHGAKSQDPNSKHTFWANLKQYMRALVRGTDDDWLGGIDEAIDDDVERQAFEICLKETDNKPFDRRPENDNFGCETRNEVYAKKKEGFDGNNNSG